MFDIGWSELLIIGVVALIVIGPKDLPRALATFGKWVARAKSMAREFQNNVDDMVRQSELDDLRKQVEQARSFNLSAEIEKNIDPNGSLRQGLSVEDFTSPATGKPDAPPPGPDPEEEADLAIAAPPTQPAPVPATPGPAASTPTISPVSPAPVPPMAKD